jgi:NAD-reducing hydrogenase small subunit
MGGEVKPAGSPAPDPAPADRRPRIATVWLGGCSGCHMSFLDMDERLIEVFEKARLVYSPIMDVKEYPEGVDVVLVEGAVANVEHLEMARRVRERTRFLISFGDCAVTGNVTALRNPLGSALPVLQRAYVETAQVNPRIPDDWSVVPRLLDRVLPLHEVVKVDFYLPGCPPPADLIYRVVVDLIAGRVPELKEAMRYG